MVVRHRTPVTPDMAVGPDERPRLDAPALDALDQRSAPGPLTDRRRFSLYDPLAAFELVDELDFLTRRSIEPVPFYAPQFLVPAMPRLDERSLRLLVARDEGEGRSRLRLLMPFSVEPTGLIAGPRCVRAWTHPFGPRGTLPVDHDDPAGTLASLFDALAEPERNLPPLLVLPDARLDGPVVAALKTEAERRGFAFAFAERRHRAALDAGADADAFLATALSARRRRELRRQRRILEAAGPVVLDVARKPSSVREAVEEFLMLEASGWKGRARSALLNDRYRAAFAREALDAMASRGRVRVYTLKAGGRPVASLVVLLAKGQAVLWKMAYDERHASASPGFQLLVAASQAMLQDPDIRFVDSCAVPDHTLVNRLWRERIEVGTLIVALRAGAQGSVASAAAALERARRFRHGAFRLRRALGRLSD